MYESQMNRQTGRYMGITNSKRSFCFHSFQKESLRPKKKLFCFIKCIVDILTDTLHYSFWNMAQNDSLRQKKLIDEKVEIRGFKRQGVNQQLYCPYYIHKGYKITEKTHQYFALGSSSDTRLNPISVSTHQTWQLYNNHVIKHNLLSFEQKITPAWETSNSSWQQIPRIYIAIELGR